MLPNEAPVSHELPQSMTVLVADDKPDHLEKNLKAVREALTPQVSELEVLPAANGIDIIRTALAKKPNVVILDDSYDNNEILWKPTPPELEEVAKEFGVNFQPIKDPANGEYFTYGPMPDNLYYPPCATSFALLLRFFGFKGKILATSGYPPPPRTIAKDLKALNEHLVKMGAPLVEEPVINGATYKRFDDQDQVFAIGPNNEGGWDFHLLKNSSYSKALNQLICATI